ncbi:MAG: tetratricopeptide repeat protein [Candidatus Melainabacteria bacterium]|nr:tetratricopeptide repeat protein [Candidatus Melainabacteria bacterium]
MTTFLLISATSSTLAFRGDRFKQDTLSTIKSLQQAHSYQKARSASLELVKRYPKDPQTHLAYAQLLAEMGLLSESIVEYRQALQLNGNLAEAFIALSKLYLQNLDPYMSLGYAQLAIKSSPQSVNARTALIEALMASEHLQEADKQIRALLKDQGSSANVLFLRYQLERKHGDLTAAKMYLESALRHCNHRVDWLLELSQVEEDLGDFAEARHTLRKALLLAPEQLEARRQLAINLEFFSQDYEAAVNEYKKLLEVDPSSVSAQAGIDRCQRKMNDLSGCLKQACYHGLSELARWLTGSSKSHP